MKPQGVFQCKNGVWQVRLRELWTFGYLIE